MTGRESQSVTQVNEMKAKTLIDNNRGINRGGWVLDWDVFVQNRLIIIGGGRRQTRLRVYTQYCRLGISRSRGGGISSLLG